MRAAETECSAAGGDKHTSQRDRTTVAAVNPQARPEGIPQASMPEER